ncbi:MAG: SdrD B-like domain-containing protein, partial [Acidobacteriota bacterium]
MKIDTRPKKSSSQQRQRTGKISYPRKNALALLLLWTLASAGSAAASTVSGTVFRDLDGDGVQDGGEPGIAGIAVESFDASSSLGTASTAADGSYTVAGGLPGEEIRIELVAPASLDFLRPGIDGAGTSPTLSFRTMPASGAGLDLDVAFANPGQHCQADPDLVINCFIRGDQSGTGDTLVSIPYTASNNTPAPGDEALENQIGTTWGMAYQRSSDSLFLSAFQKRHSGYEDGSADGTGTIYRVIDPTDGTTGGVSTFLNLNTLFGSQVAGANPHPTGADFSVDAASYDAAGKLSFGDLDISEDETTLYVVNLADRRLYAIPLGDDPSAPVAPATSAEVSRFDLFDLADCDGDGSNDLASDVDLRPFAVKVHDGQVYVGGVCSGESTQDNADLRALVWAFDPDAGTFTEVLDFGPLTYDRG